MHNKNIDLFITQLFFCFYKDTFNKLRKSKFRPKDEYLKWLADS